MMEGHGDRPVLSTPFRYKELTRILNRPSSARSVGNGGHKPAVYPEDIPAADLGPDLVKRGEPHYVTAIVGNRKQEPMTERGDITLPLTKGGAYRDKRYLDYVPGDG